MEKELKLSDLPEPNLEDLPPPGLDLASLPLPPSEGPSASRAAYLGGLQGLSAGYADELEAAIKGSPLGALKSIPGINQYTDQTSDDVQAYKEARDKARKEYEEAEKAQKGAYLGGQLGGGLATALIPGLGEANLAKMAALGAVTGIGSSTSETPTGTAVSGTLGALLGAGGYKLGGRLAKALTPEARQQAASELAEQASGVSAKKVYGGPSFVKDDTGELIRKTLEQRKKDVGLTALEEGTLSLAGGSKAMAKKATEALNKTSKEFEPVLNEANKALNKLEQEAITTSVGDITEKTTGRIGDLLDNLKGQFNEDVAFKLEKELIPVLDRIEESGNNILKLNDIKKDIWSKLRSMGKTPFEQRNPSFDPEMSAYKQLGGMLDEHIENLADKAIPGFGDKVRQLNQKFGNLNTLVESTEEQAIKDSSKSILSKTNLGLGGLSVLTHGNPAIIGGTLAKIGLEKATGQPISRLGQIALAKGNLAAAKALEKTPIQQTAQATAKIASGTLKTPEASSTAQGFLSIGQQPESQIKPVMTNNKLNEYIPRAKDSSEVSRNVYNLPKEQLQNIAQRVSQKEGYENLANALLKGLETNDSHATNAALFSILQNPNTRSIAQEYQ